MSLVTVFLVYLAFASVNGTPTNNATKENLPNLPKNIPLTAFDCLYSGAVHATLDLKNLPTCKTPRLDYKEKEEKLMEIVQTSNFIRVKGKSNLSLPGFF